MVDVQIRDIHIIEHRNEKLVTRKRVQCPRINGIDNLENDRNIKGN